MSDDLATPRERAVTLRLAGQTLAAVARQTGLSAPTITALVKAYERGGWPAVHERKRGRPRSDAATHAQPQLPELKESFLNEGASKRARGPVFTVTELAAWVTAKTGRPTNEHAAAQLLSACSCCPPMSTTARARYPRAPSTRSIGRVAQRMSSSLCRADCRSWTTRIANSSRPWQRASHEA